MPANSNKNVSGQTSWTSQPGVQQILGTASKLFESGAPWAPYTNPTVSPFSTQQVTGLQGMQALAGKSQPFLNQNFNRVNQSLNSLGPNGLTGLQDKTVNEVQKIANGNGLNAMQQKAYNDLTPTANGLNADQQQALNLLRSDATANPAANPFLNDVINNSGNDIRYQAGLNASAAGRYGSGGHEGVLAKAIGDMSTNLRYGDYNNQQQRRDAALRDFANLGTTGYGQRSNAIGAQGNLGTTGFNQRSDALSSVYNAGQQGLQNIQGGTKALSDAYDARLSPYQTMLGVGGAYQGQNQKLLDDAQRVFKETQGSMTGPVDWLAGLAHGYQGGQTGTNNTVPSNPWAQGIGGFLSGYGATGNPYLGLLSGAGNAFA